MNKKRFGLDIDGTVTCPTSFIPYLNESFEKNLSLDDITEYNLTTILGISEQEFWKWMINNEEKIYANCPKSSGVEHILNSWEKKHELYYISARGDHLLDITYKWFKQHQLPYEHIELIGRHNKIETIVKHNIEIFFEDKHDNACEISEECNIPVILFDTPYNRMAVPKNVIRVKDWKEANNWVNEWLEKAL
ncbi:5' nucleotidase, NT5C type [Bacillus taeanensis]|uniref:Nucleotidase n=1 Tax=Bacillus taeanensis TaxID=273032 RepID=A0A366Y2B1_9BACI|nr:hypothetical protein [Bacillus taeanensis]RBW70534.1 hypothetical protein DS031_05775 [Bacillus taeanensis]